MTSPGRPTPSAPPLAFVVFWNAFTAVHAFFMLRGFWGSWAMLFLLPFYAIFFSIGLWMIRAWLRAQALGQAFGEPTLQPVGAVMPGQPLRVGLEFERDWTGEGLQLAGLLRWVEVLPKGGSGKTLATAPVGGSALPGARGTTWQGAGQVPPRPAGAQPMRLELLVYPAAGDPGSGWCFPLRLDEQLPGAGDLLELTPEQADRTDRVLGWVFLGLLVLAGGLLLDGLAGGRRAFLPMLPGAGAAFAAWIVHDLRAALAEAAAAGGGSTTADEMARRMALFKADMVRRSQVFLVLALGAVLADFFEVLEKL